MTGKVRPTAEADARSTRLLVWDDDGRIRGFVAYGPARDEAQTAPDSGELLALYVDEDLIGRGAGRALHDATLDALRTAGSTGVVLWVLEANVRGRAFYARQGWAPDDLRRSDAFGDEHRTAIRLSRHPVSAERRSSRWPITGRDGSSGEACLVRPRVIHK